MKLLFVSSEHLYVKRYIKALEKQGFSVKFVGNPDDASKQFAPSIQPNVVVSDSMLGHGEIFTRHETREQTETGLALYRWIRASYRELPFVLLTSDRLALRKILAVPDPFVAAVNSTNEDSVKVLCRVVRQITATAPLATMEETR